MNYSIKKLSLVAFVSLGNVYAQCMEEKVIIASNQVSDNSLVSTFEWSHSIEFPYNYFGKCIISPNRTTALNTDEGKLIDFITAQETPLENFPDSVWEVTYSLDNSSIFAGSRNHGTAFTWNTKTGTRTQALIAHTGLIDFATFSAEGNTFLTMSKKDNTARLWNTITGKEITCLTKLNEHLHLKSVQWRYGAHLSPHGDLMLIWGEGYTTRKTHTSTLCLVNVTSGALLRTFEIEVPGAVRSVEFITNETILVVVRNGKTYLLNSNSPKPLLELYSSLYKKKLVNVSPDKKTIVAWNSYNKEISLWDTATGKELQLPKNRDKEHYDLFSDSSTFLWSLDSQTIALKSDSGTVFLLNAKTGEVQKLPNNVDTVFDASSLIGWLDGQTILIKSDQRTLRLLNIKTGDSLLLPYNAGVISSVFCSTDGNSIFIRSTHSKGAGEGSHDIFSVWNRRVNAPALTPTPQVVLEKSTDGASTQASKDAVDLHKDTLINQPNNSSDITTTLKKEPEVTPQESTTRALSENQRASSTHILGFTDGVDLEDDSQKECSIQ